MRAQRDLGLTAEQFYELTPRQFDALQEYRRTEAREAEILLASLTAMVANTGFKGFKDVKRPREFLLYGNNEAPKAELSKRHRWRRYAVEETRQSFRAWCK